MLFATNRDTKSKSCFPSCADIWRAGSAYRSALNCQSTTYASRGNATAVYKEQLNANQYMSSSDVRNIIKDLRSNLNQDSLLRADFHYNPLAVLQSVGLSQEARQNLLQYRLDSTEDSERCLCGSYFSILTAIVTTAAVDTPEAVN